MPIIEHIAILKKDTKANLDLLMSYIPSQFYLATDEGPSGEKGRYYYGSQDGSSLIGPIPVSNASNVVSLTDGDTIDFTDNGSGVWTGEVIKDPAGGNILQVSGSGVYVPQDYIRSVDNAASNAIDLSVVGGALQADIKVGTGISDTGDVISLDLNDTAPIKITGNTISLDTNNTDSIDLSVNGGNLEADVNIASGGVHADNIASIVTGKGLYVPDDFIQSVGNTTSLNLSVDGSGKLTGIVNNVAITDVVVDTTEVSMSAWIGSNYTGPEYGEGDVVILTNVPDGRESWINNGGTNSDITDWTLLEDAHITDSQIRALFSGGDGIVYNNSTGEISVDLASSNNDLEFVGGELLLDVSDGDVTDTNNISGGGVVSLQSILDSITGSITSNFNLTAEQVIFGNSAGDGLAQDSGFIYDVNGNMSYGSKALHLNGADLVFNSNTDGVVYKDSLSTNHKVSVTTYGALVLTS